MTQWNLHDIAWDQFDRTQLQPELIPLMKAASMVEHNGHDYGRYMREVFRGDADFLQAIDVWAEEEVKHGEALRRWAELADPSFDFDQSFERFTSGYKLPVNVEASVRGSRVGELVARCIVETGTSSYYTAVANATNEPVLKAVCRKIAADEFRHYKLFYDQLKTYLAKDNVGFLGRLKVALSRIRETEDDELAYAYHAANDNGTAYDRRTCTHNYQARTLAYYRKENIDRMVAMIFKAVGLKPHRTLHHLSTRLLWNMVRFKRYRLASKA